jgi:hypothetical protein
MIRSKARWLEEGEKPSKYFCHLESRNYLNKTIKRVEIQEKGIVHNQLDILREIKDYYETLYRNTDSELCDVDLFDIVHLPDIPRLDLIKKIKINPPPQKKKPTLNKQ